MDIVHQPLISPDFTTLALRLYTSPYAIIRLSFNFYHQSRGRKQ